MAEQGDTQVLIDRLNANASKLLAGEEVDRLELVNAMVAAASALGYSRPSPWVPDGFERPGSGGTAG